MSLKRIALTSAVVFGGAAVFAVTPLGRDLMHHAVPLRWTDEPARLAAAVRIGPGSRVADIGAGSGALIVEVARIIGPQGRAYATERTPEQRLAISRRAAAAGISVSVIEAADHATNLPEACCDAITLRMVMHHIADPAAFARDLRRSLRPGGRVGIIDFAPGALPHLAHDHGVDSEKMIAHFTAAGFAVERRDPQWGGRTYLVTLFIPTAHLRQHAGQHSVESAHPKED
jgi:ubiquinone/menaquinone biosynthesis C-methylase UbiE